MNAFEVGHFLVDCDEGFDDDVVYFLFDLLNISAHFLYFFKQTGQRAFVANVVLPEIFVMNKVGVALVNRVVSQVHAPVAVVAFVGRLVLGCGEAGEALPVDVN